MLAADGTAAAADTAKAADDTATAEAPAELAAWNAKMQKAQAEAADDTADGSKVARALDELCEAADSMGAEVLNAGAAAAEKAPSKSAGKRKLEEQQKQIKQWRAQLAMVGGKAQQQVKGTAQQQVKQEAAGTAADGNSNSTPPESKPKSATKPPQRLERLAPTSKAPPAVAVKPEPGGGPVKVEQHGSFLHLLQEPGFRTASGVVLCLYRFVFIFYLWKDFKDMCYCFV